MQRLVRLLAALACSGALFATPTPTEAAFLTFVSETGSGGNDCFTPATACREVGQAIAKTDAGGTVSVAPGEYTAVVVDKSITIVADQGGAIIGDALINNPVPTAIGVVLTASERVLIRGFVLNATSNAIAITGGGTIRLENCTLVGGSNQYAINFAPTSATELYVSGSSLAALPDTTGGAGVLIKPIGSASAKVVLDDVRIADHQIGILVDGAASTGVIAMNIRDSVISGNSAQGLAVFEAVSGATSTVVLERTTVSGNGGQGIVASRARATIRARQSAITGNVVGVQSLNGGQIISHGDNVLADNTTNGAFTSTVAPQ